MNDITRGPDFIGGDEPELAAEIRFRAISWSRFRAELLESYAPPLRAVATYRMMKHAVEVLEALEAVDDQGEPLLTPDGQPLPMVRTTADLNPRLLARSSRRGLPT